VEKDIERSERVIATHS